MCEIKNKVNEEDFLKLNLKFNKIVVFSEYIDNVISQEEKDFYDVYVKSAQKNLKKKKKKSKKGDNEGSDDENNSTILEDEFEDDMGADIFEKVFEDIEEISDDSSEYVLQASNIVKNFLVEYDTKRLVVQEFDYDSYFELGMSNLKVPSIIEYLNIKKKSKKNEIEFEESDPDFKLEFDEEIEKIKASLIFRNFEIKKKKKVEVKKGKKDEKPKDPFAFDLISFDHLTVDQIYSSKSYYNYYHNNSYRFKDLIDPNIRVNDISEEDNLIKNPEFQLKTHNYITSYLTQYNFNVVQIIDVRFIHDIYLQCFPFVSNIYYNYELARVFVDYDPIHYMDYRHQEVIPNSVMLDPKNYKNIELDMCQEVLNMHSNTNDENFEEELLIELLNEHSDEENE